MNKKFKLTSAILTASLLISPISGIVYQNNNVAKANYQNKKIKEIIYYSKETLEILKEYEKQNLINKEQIKEIKSELQNRGASGWIYKVKFSDGAEDIHIPGWMILVSGLSPAALATGLIKKAMHGMIATFVAQDYYNASKYGIVIYQKPVYRYNCEGTYCFNVYMMEAQHVRLDI